MAYSAESSKRKFHRLLESISDHRSTAPQENVDNEDNMAKGTLPPPEKRRKLGVPRKPAAHVLSAKIAAARLTATTSSSSYLSTLRRQALTLQSTVDRSLLQLEAPLRKLATMTYAPNDRTALLQRLGSFSKSRHYWSKKPAFINELEFAKRGWSCVDEETVSCATCNARVVIPYAKVAKSYTEEELDGLDEETREEVFSNTKVTMEHRCLSMIQQGHAETCPWRVKGSANAVYRVSFLYPKTVVERICTAFDGLQRVRTKLPQELSIPPEVNLTDLRVVFRTVYNATKKGGSELTRATVKEWEIAALFAVYGWQYHDQLQNGLVLLTCPHCLRRVGTWLWLTKSDGSSNDLKQRFGLLEEHREHCPIVNSITQDDEVPAWQKIAAMFQKRYEYVRNATEAAKEATAASPTTPGSGDEVEATGKETATNAPPTATEHEEAGPSSEATAAVVPAATPEREGVESKRARAKAAIGSFWKKSIRKK